MTTDGNRRHPGWPDYVGPTAAWCLLPHHDILCDWCPNIPERWETILREKLSCQIPVRAAHFVVLEEREMPEMLREAGEARREAREAWEKAWRETWETWETREAQKKAWREAQETWKKAQQKARPALEALLAQYVPDHRWNGEEIVFPSEV